MWRQWQVGVSGFTGMWAECWWLSTTTTTITTTTASSVSPSGCTTPRDTINRWVMYLYMQYKYANSNFQPQSWLIGGSPTTRAPFPSYEDVGWHFLTDGGEDCKRGPMKGAVRKVCRYYYSPKFIANSPTFFQQINMFTSIEASSIRITTYRLPQATVDTSVWKYWTTRNDMNMANWLPQPAIATASKTSNHCQLSVYTWCSVV